MSDVSYVASRGFRGTVLAVGQKDLIVARGGAIERCDLNFQSIEPIGIWDTSWRSIARRWSPAARFMRLNLGPSAWLGDTLVVVSRQTILRIRPHTGDVEVVPLPNGIRAPLTLTPDLGREGAEDSLLFGDYRGNREMEPIALFKLRRTGPPELIGHTAQGQVNHIHSVIPSHDGKSYFVLSGDYKDAARIWRLPRDGSALEPVTPAGQRFRSCWLVERDEVFLYATDRQDEVNELSFFCPNNASVTPISEIEGSSIDHLPRPQGDPDAVLFSTTIEGDNSERMTIRHFFNVQKGRAFHSRDALLYRFDLSSGHLERLFAARKDWMPFVPFQFGRLRIPPQSANRAGPIFVNATAVYGSACGALRLDPRRSS